MSRKRRSALMPLLVCVLAVTAGCSGGLMGDGSDMGSNTTAESTADGTPAGATDADGDPTFLQTHESTLREAGNVTVDSTYVERLPDQNRTTQNVSREARVEFDSGRILTVIDSRSGTPVERYRTESGATFARSTEGLEPSYRGPNATADVNASERVLLFPVDPSTLERDGRRTVDGVTGNVYTADSTGSAADNGYERYFQYNVTEFSLTFVVDDSGHVSYGRVDLTTVRQGTPLSVSQRVRYTDVGSTTVPEPDWLDDAKAAATESGSGVGEGTATDDE